MVKLKGRKKKKKKKKKKKNKALPHPTSPTEDVSMYHKRLRKFEKPINMKEMIERSKVENLPIST